MISPTDSTRLSGSDRETEGEESSGSHRSKRHRRGHRACYHRARVLLLVLFVAYNAMNVSFVFITPERMRSHLWAPLITTSLWATFLFVAMWLRQKWARYVMVIIQLLGAVFGFISISDLFLPETHLRYPAIRWVFIGYVALHASIAWILITSHDLKRLTSRAYE